MRQPPRYYVIEQELRRQIVTMKPGDPLPSEAALCEQFGVSRMTARNSIQGLVQDGIVKRVAGRGTFVARPLTEEDTEPRARGDQTRTTRNTARTLDAAVALLDVLAVEGEATASRLADRLGEAKASVNDLLQNLERLDLVEQQAGSGIYRLGLRTVRLGAAFTSRLDERSAALPIMQRVHRETQETVNLLVRRGLEAVCIESLRGVVVQVRIVSIGTSLPLHVGAAPRALLAYEPEEFWAHYLSTAELGSFTDRTATSPAEITAMLRKIRKSGLSLSDEDVIPGIATIAVPIFDHTGRVRAAMSLGGPRESIVASKARARNAARMKAAGAEVSATLGYREPVPSER